MMSTYRAHTDGCVTIMLSLNGVLPSELIQMIVKLHWELLSMPVLMLFTSDTCYSCRKLEEIWYPSPLGQVSEGESILCKLTEMYLGLRFVNAPSSDLGLYPAYVRRHIKWFPMILLIPGPLWDHAMLYPESDIELIDGVQVFNGIWEDSASLDDASSVLSVICSIRPKINSKVLMYHPKYDIREVDHFIRWFTESLNNPEFIAAQNKLI
jgi:hypothetical protein